MNTSSDFLKFPGTSPIEVVKVLVRTSSGIVSVGKFSGGRSLLRLSGRCGS